MNKPRIDREAVMKLRKEGLSMRLIAERLHCSYSGVNRLVAGKKRYTNRKRESEADRKRRAALMVRPPIVYDDNDRCGGCGLMLPCFNCPTNIDAFAASGTSPLGRAADQALSGSETGPL